MASYAPCRGQRLPSRDDGVRNPAACMPRPISIDVARRGCARNLALRRHHEGHRRAHRSPFDSHLPRWSRAHLTSSARRTPAATASDLLRFRIRLRLARPRRCKDRPCKGPADTSVLPTQMRRLHRVKTPNPCPHYVHRTYRGVRECTPRASPMPRHPPGGSTQTLRRYSRGLLFFLSASATKMWLGM